MSEDVTRPMRHHHHHHHPNPIGKILCFLRFRKHMPKLDEQNLSGNEKHFAKLQLFLRKKGKSRCPTFFLSRLFKDLSEQRKKKCLQEKNEKSTKKMNTMNEKGIIIHNRDLKKRLENPSTSIQQVETKKETAKSQKVKKKKYYNNKRYPSVIHLDPGIKIL